MESSLQIGGDGSHRGSAVRQLGGEPPGGRSLRDVLDGLDNATRDFNRMVEMAAKRAEETGSEAATRTRVAAERRERRRAERRASGDKPADLVERRLATAELEAQALLAEAHDRVERLVQSILSGVEAEAARIEREAIGAAERRLRHANETASAMVEERQRHISELSDGICARAERLAAQIEGAEKVRAQFVKLAAGLGSTADRIADDHLAGKT